MMKCEFEKLAGYEVTIEDYEKIIEPMYMATDLSKEDFVKVIDKKRFALKTKEQLIRKMKRIAKHLKETCTQYTDYEAKEELKQIVEEYGERFSQRYCYTEDEMIWSCFYPNKLATVDGDIYLV